MAFLNIFMNFTSINIMRLNNMNKYLIFTIAILLVNLFSCNSQFKENVTELKEIKRFTLEETSDVIINNITGICFNHDSTKFIVSDFLTGSITIIYNDNGKIYKYFKPNFSLIDSIIENNKYIGSSKTKLLNFKDIYSFLNDNVDSLDLRGNIIHSFNHSLFINDSIIYIIAKIKVFISNKDGEISNKKCEILQLPAFIKINIINNQTNVIGIEMNKYLNTIVQSYPFTFDKKNNIFLNSVITQRSKLLEKQSKAYSISSFNLDGYWVEDLFELPNDYLETGIYYSIPYNPEICINKKSQIISIYPYSENIYNFSNNRIIKIENLPFSNDKLLKDLKKDNTLLLSLRDSILNYLYNKIDNLNISVNGNYIVSIFCKYWSNPDDYVQNGYNIVREYTPDGELVRDVKIKAINDDGVVKYITYTSKEDALMIFRFSDTKGWTVIYSKFE